jgi:penicillin-binding protein 1B
MAKKTRVSPKKKGRAPPKAKKASKRAAAPKKRKSSPRKRRGPAVTSKVKTPLRSRLKRWLIWESVTVGAGVAVGLAIAGSALWSRAKQDVVTYLANPPRTAPGVIWSAAMEIRKGQTASVGAIAGDLLAAGYDRVDHVVATTDTPGVFSVTDGRVEIWTEAMTGSGFTVPQGRTTLRIQDGRVVSTSPPEGLVLRPTVLGTVGDVEGRRTEVALEKLSPWMEPALLAMEDARFREHAGVDPIGIARALVSNLIRGRRMQGGSTLTQQLAKNLFLTPDRTLRRKVREAFFAAALEHELSKDDLLELYLGEVYLGQMGGLPLYGVEQASRAWFGVSAERLELHQAATIVGVISAPNAYSPVRHPERSIAQRNKVLARMVKTDAIDAALSSTASERPLTLVGIEPSRVRRAPYAVDVAVDHAEAALGEGALSSGGYQVFTHIQPVLQRAAEDAVTQGMAELDREYPKAAGAQVALVAVRVQDGAVVAMVGGRSYAKSPFNRATSAWRQAGSTVKPLTMLAAFDDGSLAPSDRLKDEPISRKIDGKMWTPRNYDGTFKGRVTVREAIESSRNIPAILMAEEVGASRLQRFYREAGLTRSTNLPSAALGSFATAPLELAGAYTVFPGGGVGRVPQTVQAITDADGQSVLTFKPQTIDLVHEQAAAQATRVLQGVIDAGTGARATRYGVQQPAGGKTGTTDDYRDAWFVGFTPELAVAVWVGRDKGTLGLSGSRGALPTWSRFIASAGDSNARFPSAKGLVTAEVCAESGMPARDACDESYPEFFVKGTLPKEKCDLHGEPNVQVGRVFGGLFRKRARQEE